MTGLVVRAAIRAGTRTAGRPQKAAKSHLSLVRSHHRIPAAPHRASIRPAGSRAASALNGTSRDRSRTPSHVTRASDGGMPAALKEDEVLRSIADNGEASVLVANATHLVAEAQRRHNLSPIATAALGRAMVGTMLMATFKGEEETTQVQIKGDGPLGTIMVVSDEKGQVKGLVGNPGCETLIRDTEDGAAPVLDVAGAVGKPGFITVTRSHPAMKEPYTGTIPIYSGEIGEDLAHYMADSEQVQSALAVGVRMDKEGKVTQAGGWLIQVLPFVGDDTLEFIETNIAKLPPITECIEGGMSPAEVTMALLEGIGVSDGGFAITPKYGPCDPDELKRRMARAVATLGESEVQSLIAEQGHVEVRCDFCNEMVQFNEDDITRQVEAAEKEAAARMASEKGMDREAPE